MAIYAHYKPYEIEDGAMLGDIIVEKVIKIREDGDIVTKKVVLKPAKRKAPVRKMKRRKAK